MSCEIKFIRSGNAEVDQYIESLETWITDFDASNITKLIKSCDNIAGIISSDMDIIAESDPEDELDSKLKILSASRQKVYDRLMVTIQKLDSFRGVQATLESSKPKVSQLVNESATEAKILPLEQSKSKTNIQDFFIKNGKGS